MGGEAVQVKAVLQDGPLSPRAALQLIVGVCEAVAAPGVLVPGGRPLSAGAILLAADGTPTLQEVGEADSLLVGMLLAQLLLGRTALPASEEGLLTALDAVLQQPEIDRDQRLALLTIVRACHSPRAEGRPPLHRIQRRCQELLPSASGSPLVALLRRRAEPATHWMDLHEDDVSEEVRGLQELLQRAPPEPDAAPEPAPAAPQKARRPAPPTATEPAGPGLPLVLVVGVGAVVALALGGGYYARSRIAADQAAQAAQQASRTPFRVEGIVGRTSGPEGRSLTLLSVPEGAAVVVDGMALGATPVEGLLLDVGVHHILLKGEDKTTFEQTVMVDRDARCTWEPGAAAEGGEPWRCETL